MPGRAQELPLRALARVLLIFVLSFGAAPLRAQEPDAPFPADPVRGFLELSLGATSVRRQTSPLLGAAALLGVSSDWRVGGAGFSMMVENLELHIGYAGLLVERVLRPLYTPDSGRPANVVARLTIGAGNGEVRDAATGARLRSDNFAVLEPALSLQVPLSRLISAGATAGYRVVGGVDGLQGVEEENLTGWSLGLLIRAGPF
jgi:hypothetical protein